MKHYRKRTRDPRKSDSPKEGPEEEAEGRQPHTGTITSVSVQKRDPNRVSVFVDKRFSFGIPADLVFELGLRNGVELTQELLDTCLVRDQRYRARRKALDLLAYRPRTRAELASRLARAGFEPDVTEYALERMDALGYIDDEAYGRTYARERLVNRGFGPRRVVTELGKRGIPRATAERLVAELSGERSEQDDAYRQALSIATRLERETDVTKRRRKLWSYLTRRGFGSDTVRAVSDRLLAPDGTVRREDE